jgi:NAD(P)-dependent dehydrogenase (short-subunit alcohol dehydrogenase family)
LVNRLDGKIAIVLGAGSAGPGWSNGRATAALFAAERAAVFAVDRDEESLAETCRLIHAKGGTVAHHVADVTRPDALAGAISTCRSAFDRIDILVNNVGGSQPGGPVELDEAVWQEQLDRNLTYVYRACKEVLPIMLEQGGGVIVNLSSIAAIRHYGPVVAAYAASKAGVMQLTRSIALQYASRGIRCNCIVPGLMDTPLVTARLAGQQTDDDLEAFKARRHRLVPMGRMGDAWDVAHAALFLASDEARTITAAELVVDGGLSARAVNLVEEA